MTYDEQDNAATIVGNKAFNELIDLKVEIAEAYRISKAIEKEFKEQTRKLITSRLP